MGTVLLILALAFAALLLGEVVFDWVMRRIVGRAAQSFAVPKDDAEALLGKSHKGWRLWSLRLAAFGIITVLLWALLPRPRNSAKWVANKAVNKAINSGFDSATQRIPGGAAHSEQIKSGLKRGAQRAKEIARPK